MANGFAKLALATCIVASSTGLAASRDFIVRFTGATTVAQAQEQLRGHDVTVVRVLVPSMNLFLVRAEGERSSRSILSTLNRSDSIAYAQEDHAVSMRFVPDDEDYHRQWSLKNSDGGADVRAEGAWALMSHFSHRFRNDDPNAPVIAIVDGGIDIEHPDLKDNIFVNRAEIPNNGIDDDGNGYVDDVYGWNAYNDSPTIPANKHGTHVAGIAAARGNNGSFIAGVDFQGKVLAVAASSHKTSVIAAGYGYVIAQKKLWLESGGRKGANIVVTNSSFGVDRADCAKGEYPVWNDLYEEMGKLGILSAAATANQNYDVDVVGDVPTGCQSEYIIAVTNSTKDDTRYSSAAFGKQNVDLAAPGTAIYSLLPSESAGPLTGTSMATPHVAGAIGLLAKMCPPAMQRMFVSNPGQAALMLKQVLLASVDKIPAFATTTATGGRLNLERAARYLVGSHAAFDALKFVRFGY